MYAVEMECLPESIRQGKTITLTLDYRPEDGRFGPSSG